ncbi:MAG: heme-copper oxidase subunit III [Alphaproteobacteria bacterium]|nr:heme-copper oxidase subunit III [Alphaproteobacteria bacterium]MCB9699177.1 heme-copper oxidase subunit III [Alphaproteobacteria bacterium]
MMMFILTELMLFSGFISAFTISKAQAPAWPPPGQPRLPVEATAINTAILLASGAMLWYAGRRFDKVGPAAARVPLATAVALGLGFVTFQGVEWARLLGEGLTMVGSTYGAFFFLIIGFHGLHVMAGATALIWQGTSLWREKLTSDGFWAGRLFWYFVVLVWPALYWKVYL